MKTWEKDGIVYFEEPYRVTFLEWMNKVGGCDSLVLKKEERTEDGCDNWIYVVAYAKTKFHNEFLQKVVLPELSKTQELDIEQGYDDAPSFLEVQIKKAEPIRTHEEYGIVYFDKPYRTRLTPWGIERQSCSSLILAETEETEDGEDEYIQVVAYSTSKSLNMYLELVVRDELSKSYNIEVLPGTLSTAGIGGLYV